MLVVSEYPKNIKDLSKWELSGLLQVYGGKILLEDDLLFVFETNFPYDLADRIAFSKRIGILLNNSEFPVKLENGTTYAIREVKDIAKQSMIKEIAQKIIGKVNLTKPDRVFYIYNRKEYALVAEIISEKRTSKIIDQRYKNRPMNHPSSISPLLSIGMLNISGAKKGDLIVDPFAGTGTILIEAMRMGIKAKGIDKNIRMVNGGNDNLAHFSYERSIIHGDFMLMRNFENVFAVVTDPPYGRGSKIFSDSRRALYKNFFSLLSTMNDTRAVFCLPSAELLEDAESYLELTIVSKIRVHSSLTRIIVKSF